MKRHKILFILSLICLSNTYALNKLAGVYYECPQNLKRFQNPDEITDSIPPRPNGIYIDSFDLDIAGPSVGVQFYENRILFLRDTRIQKDLVPDHIVFGTYDNFQVVIEEGASDVKGPFSEQFVFPYPPEATSFSIDYQTMYFTKQPDGNKSLGILKIYKSVSEKLPESNKYEWLENSNILPFCQDGFSYLYPTLSFDGKMMVFSSDRSSDNGEMNLFMVLKKGNGWSNPVKLVKSINTEGNEIFPFLDSENNLFFSSNGHPGYGGYDLYICPFIGAGWQAPINLGSQINSLENDLALKFSYQDLKLAFYSKKKYNDTNKPQLFKISLVGRYIHEGDSTGPKIVELTKALTLMALSEEFALIDTASQPIIASKPPKKQFNTITQQQKSKSVQEKEIIEEKPKDKKTIAEISKSVVVTDVKPEITTPPIVFRVQILSTSNRNPDLEVNIDNQKYKPFVYYFKGAYRYCVGAFSSPDQAVELQGKCRKSGYAQAFIAAFRGEERVTDPSVFRRK